MTELNKDEQKAVVKQAIKEWMDERAMELGWFVLKKFIVAAGLFLLLWYIQFRGYKFP